MRNFLLSSNQVGTAKCSFTKNANFPSIRQMFIGGPNTDKYAENAALNKMDTIPALVELVIYLGNRC